MNSLSLSLPLPSLPLSLPLFLCVDLNILDWGKNNILAIGLGSSVFLWNAKDGSVNQLMDLDSESDYVSSVSWAGNGKYLAVGSTDAAIQVGYHSNTCILVHVHVLVYMLHNACTCMLLLYNVHISMLSVLLSLSMLFPVMGCC